MADIIRKALGNFFRATVLGLFDKSVLQGVHFPVLIGLLQRIPQHILYGFRRNTPTRHNTSSGHGADGQMVCFFLVHRTGTFLQLIHKLLTIFFLEPGCHCLGCNRSEFVCLLFIGGDH